MKAKPSFRQLAVAFLCVGFAGCSIGLSGRATLNKDGSGVVIDGEDAMVITAKRRDLAEPSTSKAKIVGQKIEITEKVMFEIDKATIKEESHGLLNDVATVLKDNPGIKKIRIEGHTDSQGSDIYNQRLSDDRAKSVRDFLIDAGIDENRMEAVGYGESQPLADNETAAGREKNRRVEFNIIEGSGDNTGAEDASADVVDSSAEAPTADEE